MPKNMVGSYRLYVVKCWTYGYGVDDVYVWAKTPEQAVEFAAQHTGFSKERLLDNVSVVRLSPGVVSQSCYVE